MRSIQRLAIVCCAMFLFAPAVELSAQDPDDPFKSNFDANPFGQKNQRLDKALINPVPKVPLTKQPVRVKIDVTERLNRLQQQNAQLRNALDRSVFELKVAKRKIAESEQNRADLIKKLNSTLDDAKVRQARDEFGGKAYLDLLAKLLASDDSARQLVALNDLMQVRNQSAQQGLAYLPGNFDIVKQLDCLLDSENKEVQERAVTALLVVKPEHAIERGFQPRPAGFWKAVPTYSMTAAKIRRAFQEPCRMEYDETLVAEIAEEFMSRYGFDFYIDETVKPNTPVTISVTNQTLGSGLELFAGKLGLVVAVLDDSVKLVPRESPEAMSTLTYNVRGLLSDDISIEKLSELSAGQIDSASKVWVVGKHQLVAKATEKEQRKISLLLGSLSRTE